MAHQIRVLVESRGGAWPKELDSIAAAMLQNFWSSALQNNGSVERRMIDELHRHGGEWLVTHEEMAKAIGATREYITRTMSRTRKIRPMQNGTPHGFRLA